MTEFSAVHGLAAALLAYLDPGTGSYVLQLLIAALLGAGFVVKTYWKNIKKGVRKLFKRDEITPGDES